MDIVRGSTRELWLPISRIEAAVAPSGRKTQIRGRVEMGSLRVALGEGQRERRAESAAAGASFFFGWAALGLVDAWLEGRGRKKRHSANARRAIR